MRRIVIFKKHPTIKGAIASKHNIKKGDIVFLYGRGRPRGVVLKVDRSLYHKGRGSIWYDVKLSSGKVITRRDVDFAEVYRR